MSLIQPDALSGFNFFVEGQGQGGKIKKFPLPDLEFEQESHQAGSMIMPISVDMILNQIQLRGVELVGATPVLWKSFKQRTVDGLGLRCQGTYKAPTDTRQKRLVATFRGKWTKHANEPYEVKKLGGLVADGDFVYYKLEYDGEVIHEIDALQSVCIIDGVDIMDEYRKNLNL